MSWIQKLYETYESCHGAPQFEADPLIPICHVRQQAHVEVVLDPKGGVRRAGVVQKEPTVIPATEDSASRSSNEAPHPLCDKIQYCAKDYANRGGRKNPYFNSYITLLQEWSDSPFGHPKLEAVLAYLSGGTLLADLLASKVIVADARGKLLDQWESDTPMPPLLKLLTPKGGKRDQGDALVRWRVERPGEQETAVWEDRELHERWIQFSMSRVKARGVCLVTGLSSIPVASKHPRGIRYAGDGAKLISSNDNENYTFRGRFEEGQEVCSVGFEATQKAHAALTWLIQRQGGRGKSGEQVVVSWTVGGERIPDPMGNTAELLADLKDGAAVEPAYQGDAGQQLALRLNKLAAGYGTTLGDTREVVIMGLDSASPGRIAITFYRELTGSEFLERLLDWHSSHAWRQNFSKELCFVGAPAPHDIAEVAFGKRPDDRLRKSTVERLLPCIVDGRSVPHDLVDSVFHRSCNRAGLRRWEWEKCLGIACGLYRGLRRREGYHMSLEENRSTRDYLFGRLLAIAEHIEQRALHLADEKRDTNAARLMQRFADHPASTWRSIELALTPYKARLRANRPALSVKFDKALDFVTGMFRPEDYTADARLTGEFLLGYHCQRAALWAKQVEDATMRSENETMEQGDES